MFAVIKTGGKQYKVKAGDTILVEKLEGEEGSAVTFDQVLFLGNEDEISVGAPLVKGAKVEGKLVRTSKGKKVIGIKHKAKKRYKVKFGHRQTMTRVEITKVSSGDK